MPFLKYQEPKELGSVCFWSVSPTHCKFLTLVGHYHSPGLQTERPPACLPSVRTRETLPCPALLSSSPCRNEMSHSSQSCFLRWRQFSESELRIESPGSFCGTHCGAPPALPWNSGFGFSSHQQLSTASTAALCSREFSGCWRVGIWVGERAETVGR